MYQWRINGTGTDAFGFQIDTSIYRPDVETRRNPVQIPGLHGELSPRGPQVFEAPMVKMVVSSVAGCDLDIEDARDAFTVYVTQPNPVLERVRGAIVHYIPVELVNLSWQENESIGWWQGSAVFACPSVFFRDKDLTVWSSPMASLLTNVEVSKLATSTAPITDAVVRFTGPITNPSITDRASGTSLSWTGSVPANSYLYLDTKQLVARMSASSSAWATGGTVVTSGLGYGAAGHLQLWPLPQSGSPLTRSVRVDAAGTGMTSATGLAIRAEGSFL